MQNTKIEWCHHTINLWWGCTKVSPGCANCYAESLSNRFRKNIWGKGKTREDHRKNACRAALKLNKQAAHDLAAWETMRDELASRGSVIQEPKPERPRIFCSSMSDWLDEEVPIEWLTDLLQLISFTPHLDWLLLTKRPQNFRPRLDEVLADFAPNCCTLEESSLYTWVKNMRDGWQGVTYCAAGRENYWIGTTVEDQARANERIPLLLNIPASVRFLSCEPLLEAVEFSNVTKRKDAVSQLGKKSLDGIHWIITGGESGTGHRPFNAEWARSIRDQCKAAGVPFFMKQMGGNRKPFPQIPADLMIREFPINTH